MTRRGLAVNDPVFSAEICNLIPVLNGYARLLYRDSELAADLTQETLTKAWKARGSFLPGTNLKAWLFAIMRNQFVSEARRAWRQVQWDQGAADEIQAPPDQQLWSLELAETAHAINALPERQREALILAGVGGFSTDDAAVMLRCRPTAVKSRICRARKTVRAALEGTCQVKTARSPHYVVPIAHMVDEMQRLSVRRSGKGFCRC